MRLRVLIKTLTFRALFHLDSCTSNIPTELQLGHNALIHFAKSGDKCQRPCVPVCLDSTERSGGSTIGSEVQTRNDSSFKVQKLDPDDTGEGSFGEGVQLHLLEVENTVIENKKRKPLMRVISVTTSALQVCTERNCFQTSQFEHENCTHAGSTNKPPVTRNALSHNSTFSMRQFCETMESAFWFVTPHATPRPDPPHTHTHKRH